MFFPPSPIEIVGRLKGWTFVFPFSSLMNEWMSGECLYEGTFDRDKLQINEFKVKANIGILDT